jgi:hypothetical protein
MLSLRLFIYKQNIMKGKFLITTDNWFYAPDGKQYRSVWGEVEIVSDSILGIKTNVRSSNWFAKVGSDENHLIIAGCQIHYACKSEAKPNTERVDDWSNTTGKLEEYKRPSNIYIAE